MGAQPQTALAIAVVPFGTDAKIEGTLYQMMAGALKILTAAGCVLVGGHTCEGDEAALGAPFDLLKTCILQLGVMVMTRSLSCC